MITLQLDEDVPIMDVIKGLAAAGLTMSNIDGWTFRVHRIANIEKVIDLAARRDARTDAEIRSGMHSLFDPPPGPGAA